MARDALPAIVVMGVCGCGKSSIGEALAQQSGAAFVEGDALHPPASIAKMARGEPLDDEDRKPWLETICRAIAENRAGGRGVVVSCSALRRAYRDHLRSAGPLQFVFLSGSTTVLAERMSRREGHFMPLALLDSQLAALEDPTGEADVVTVDIDRPLIEVMACAGAALRRAPLGRPVIDLPMADGS